MNKIKVEDMACFEQVAKVIGVANAKRELFVSMKDYRFKCYHDCLLKEAFGWAATPQGYEFWRDINRGINPYK